MKFPARSPDENPIDTAVCPLCGGPNRCAMADDPNAAECWCESVEIPDGLLELIPKYEFRRTCICQTCIEQYKESAGALDDLS